MFFAIYTTTERNICQSHTGALKKRLQEREKVLVCVCVCVLPITCEHLGLEDHTVSEAYADGLPNGGFLISSGPTAGVKAIYVT